MKRKNQLLEVVDILAEPALRAAYDEAAAAYTAELAAANAEIERLRAESSRIERTDDMGDC